MIAFRDQKSKEEGFELLVHTNPDGIAQELDLLLMEVQFTLIL